MPHILDKDVQTDGTEEPDKTSHAIDVTTELGPSKYNHIMNYYRDELFETFDENNLKRKTGEHKKLRRNDFCAVKEMFVKGLGLNIKVGEKRKKQKVHTSNNNNAVTQKIGKLKEDNDNEAHIGFDDNFNTVPLESETYICDCCNNTFDAKGLIIWNLNSNKFRRNTKKAASRPLVKRIVGEINCTEHIHRKIAKKRNKSKSEKTKVVDDNVVTFCDEDNATSIHGTVKVPREELVISNDRQNIQITNNDSEITDNFKDSNGDRPIHFAADFDLKQTQVNPKRNVIHDNCEKTFEDQGSLISHSLGHKLINDLITAKESMIMNKTKKDHKKTQFLKANDLILKCESEEKVKNIRTDIHEERDSNDVKIAKQGRLMARRMHLAAHTFSNDRYIRESRFITTDNGTIQEHKEIEALHYLKVNENDEKNIRTDGKEGNSNYINNAEQTNRVMTATMPQVKNHENNALIKRTSSDEDYAAAIQENIKVPGHDIVISNREIRNRITGKVRLIEAGCATLKPFKLDKRNLEVKKNKKKYNREKHSQSTNEEDPNRPIHSLAEPSKELIRNHSQHSERSKLKLNGHNHSKSEPHRSKHILLEANRTNHSLPETSDLDIMPHILDEDVQTDGTEEPDKTSHAIDVTTELGSSKYNHIMNYYRDELFETFDENNLKRKTGEHKKLRRNDFSAVKEMFVKGLGWNIKVGEKRKKLSVHASNNNNAVTQKIGKLKEDNGNEVHKGFDDNFNTVPLESETYICDCCNNTFDAKGSIILHLNSNKFRRNAKKAASRPLVKRIVGKINCNENIHRKIAKKRNKLKSSEKTKVVDDNVVTFCDEDNATSIHDTVKVPGEELLISNDRQNIQITNNNSEITDNFKDSNGDRPIHFAENLDLKQTQDPERNVIHDNCKKTFEDQGSLISHSLGHKLINDLITAKESMIMNKTKEDHKKTEFLKANDLILKCESEEKVKNIRTDIHEERDSNDSKIAKQARLMARRMHLAAHTFLNDRNIRESRFITTDNRTIQEHKEIETLHYLKVNENDEKNIRTDGEEGNSNYSNNAEQTNRVMTTTMPQVKNHENNALIKRTFSDEDNAAAIQENIKVPGHDLVISNREVIQIINNDSEVRDNFKDSNDDRPIHLAENLDLKQIQEDPERNVICDHCVKTFANKGSLIFHLLAHKFMNAKESLIMNKTEQDHNKIVILKATDVQLKWRKEKGITLMLPIIKLERCNSDIHLIEKPTSQTTYEFCTLCEYKTPYAIRLKRHQRVHTISFKCEHCKKSFRKRNNLEIHLRTHAGEQYQCRCGSTFARIDALNRHLKTHTKEKKYRRHSVIHAGNTHKCIACV